MSDPVSEFTLSIQRIQDYEFLVKFDKPEGLELHTDETPPLGKDQGPSPSRMLAAAIGNCLSASFLFASHKAGLSIGDVQTDVKVRIVRNQKRRLRIGRIEVSIDPRLAGDAAGNARGTREVFEDFCTVTQSVREGIEIEVKVKGIDG